MGLPLAIDNFTLRFTEMDQLEEPDPKSSDRWLAEVVRAAAHGYEDPFKIKSKEQVTHDYLAGNIIIATLRMQARLATFFKACGTPLTNNTSHILYFCGCIQQQRQIASSRGTLDIATCSFQREAYPITRHSSTQSPASSPSRPYPLTLSTRYTS